MATITIGKLAKSCGVNIDTIRYYERRKLLFPVERTAAGYRKYSTDSIERLGFVRTAQGLGFTLKEIKGLLEITEDPNADCADIRAMARQKLAEIEPRIADLKKIKAALEELSEFCPGKGHGLNDCTILRYFYGTEA
ncbi:hypothetical protein MNBD_ALPHA04-1925 [hydrothermal vent metagenome]|uniref:HTH merR-type domain-containing protein n=1 Tax=hydrothermal vent metagenome TaxID=652676 RepID=A0A3B0RD59_9ZZZZ